MFRASSSFAWRWPFGLAAVGLVFGLVFSFLLPFQRASTVRVLITQPNAAGLDPYTAIKATERVASSLSELVYTTSFFDNVLSQSRDVRVSYFPQNERARRKLWRKTIATSIAPGTGIMSITAFHPDQAQARVVVDAVAREMATQVPNVFGYSIRVQIIDAPLDSRWFARPNFVWNALAGAGAGFLLGALLLLTRSLRDMRE